MDDGGAVLAEVAQLLKQRTSGTHGRVEATLDLLDPHLSASRLRSVLARFAGFWSGTEPVIDAWAEREPEFARSLDWSRRRRCGHLRSDVAALDAALGAAPDTALDPEPAAAPELAEPVVREPSPADVLGWLYVTEGATLGGAVITRRLRDLTSSLGVQLASFLPYPEGPGPMWRAYLTQVDAWAGGDAARTEAVLAAALRTFEALAGWLEPLRVDVAA